MTVALITIAFAMLLNLFGLVVSLRVDREGLPEAINGQYVKRKLNTFKPRIPKILQNLIGQWVGILVGFIIFEDYLPIVWPGLLTLVLQLGLVTVIDDVCFYGVHRFLHENRWAYRKIHKIHHEAYAPVPLEYIYVHPAEQAMGAVGVALGLGAVALIWGQLPAWTIWFYLAFRVLHELDIHSGMKHFTSKIPLLAPMRHHDLHHARPNMGNYASFFPWWDRLLGTTISEEKLKKNKKRG